MRESGDKTNRYLNLTLNPNPNSNPNPNLNPNPEQEYDPQELNQRIQSAEKAESPSS